MSWIPTIVTFIAAGVMVFYPLNQKKMDDITIELQKRRELEKAN
jgi:GPH family glycoside/pentoside/hexuronide:cation symporter